MLTFKQYLEEVKLGKNPCWAGYAPVKGDELKKKNGKFVPNCVKEDGMAGAVSAGPTNAVSSGSIAGSGGKGGEPGVSKKRNPIMAPTFKRNPPQL
jgi:hypothetical protein